MFDQLFASPFALARYRTSPLVDERRAYLVHLAKLGYARDTLRRTAYDLVVVVKMLGLAHRLRKAMTLDEVKCKTANQHHLFLLAVRWLQFMGCLKQRPTPPAPWAKKIKAFADYMENEKELRPETIRRRCRFVSRFLSQMDITGGSLHGITAGRIDTAFQRLLDQGGYARTTVRGSAGSLRAFFRFAGAQGWCGKQLATSIRAPRVFSQVSLPAGPSWDDVRRLLAMTEGAQRNNVRARPMLMLLAIYGLRAGEVTRLRLENFDWEHEMFRVISCKTRRVRTYPLTRSVGDAIVRYLQEVRPRSSHRELFLSLRPPFRPLHTSSLWRMVGGRLRSLHLSLPHYGPHALRHACATRLLDAGLSLKEIGDQLGHADPDSTRIYAKVDLAGLREVANFDLGGVL